MFDRRYQNQTDILITKMRRESSPLLASRSSLSSTTGRSWRMPIGSSTSAPGAGNDSGRIMFEGAPADLVAARSTLTGKHLAAYIGT
jgi:hypothetical protein